ncbi:Alpha-ketoglutaric semialdehyde dehydrogenase 3 [Methylobacterium cerastii]|uniref:Alpha-ketoglutaric semialdehyde dehydrogenase 3 n=1 Tax=Methylobacterium cerastii TaxID=932741 RepID=A0ABQ4QLB5_9HYPH|nr:MULTISPECIES: hypothetical protein [Methylobacterium]TXM98895.1 hypothetical protein FV219_13990 [Methylobacterium sp. WL122]TXM68565.1 hypothetical protein FV229_07445 [Methylobacterium sp. WL120]TXM72329.1 hypothetical protein FV226_12390 [Methylobacterium sp. WL12]TXN81860.1 hypothetical protein FV234_11740 [Methylobacterium sp. WL8]GJD46038.1 Alpha-ketoglutaric semialdehyde dehydrogenase 3 [Methylobacterium cerastii]
MAKAILGIGDALVTTCMAETGLPHAWHAGERARTVGRLSLFADMRRQRDFLYVRMNAAQLDRKSLPCPNLSLSPCLGR